MKKVKVALEQAMKAQSGSGGIALLFFNLGTRCGCVVNATPRPLYLRERDPVPIVWEAGWAPEPVWMGAENLTPPRSDLRTVQPVASHYNYFAIPAHS